MRYSHEELEQKCDRLTNQVQALKHSNLLLIALLGKLIQQQPIDPAFVEQLRRQYLALQTLKDPKK